MNCIVEYMFKQGTRSYTEFSTVVPFTTVDQAIAFIDDMKKSFHNSIEWMYIHLEISKCQ